MPRDERPGVVILAGPNGSGKSTSALRLLKGTLGVLEFVNADVIARGLSGFSPEKAAMAAGRVMLARLKELAEKREDFAFETTLASRTFAPWLEGLIESGYACHIVFLWLPNPEVAIARVADRVRMGGHNVPEETIRRRYVAGIKNFFELYRDLATTWKMLDNSHGRWTTLVAAGQGNLTEEIRNETQWRRILGQAGLG